MAIQLILIQKSILIHTRTHTQLTAIWTTAKYSTPGDTGVQERCLGSGTSHYPDDKDLPGKITLTPDRN